MDIVWVKIMLHKGLKDNITSVTRMGRLSIKLGLEDMCARDLQTSCPKEEKETFRGRMEKELNATPDGEIMTVCEQGEVDTGLTGNRE